MDQCPFGLFDAAALAPAEAAKAANSSHIKVYQLSFNAI
jgi:hypothetical protein